MQKSGDLQCQRRGQIGLTSRLVVVHVDALELRWAKGKALGRQCSQAHQGGRADAGLGGGPPARTQLCGREASGGPNARKANDGSPADRSRRGRCRWGPRRARRTRPALQVIQGWGRGGRGRARLCQAARRRRGSREIANRRRSLPPARPCCQPLRGPHLPELGTDLVAALASLDVHDLPHCEGLLPKGERLMECERPCAIRRQRPRPQTAASSAGASDSRDGKYCAPPSGSHAETAGWRAQISGRARTTLAWRRREAGAIGHGALRARIEILSLPGRALFRPHAHG